MTIDPANMTPDEMRAWIAEHSQVAEATVKTTHGPYKWRKDVYLITVPMTDDAKVGDVIRVDDRDGGSDQVIISVTPKRNKAGNLAYKIIIVEAVTSTRNGTIDVNA
jgi:hypothetical protein